MTMEIPKRTLGRTGVEVTLLGLGGEGVLRTFGFEREAYTRLSRAIFPLTVKITNLNLQRRTSRSGCEMFEMSCSIARERAKLNGMARGNTDFEQDRSQPALRP